jgi:hypothetical protein
MRGIIFFLLVALLSQRVDAQRVKLNKGRTSARNYLARVPYETMQGKIIIPVEIEGNTYRFLFDTGAPNMITPSLNEQLTSKKLNDINVRDANGNRQKMSVVSLSSIGIGGIYFEGVPTIVNNPESNFIFDCFGVDGIIGSNMMRKTVVHLDSEKLMFSISNDPGHFEVERLEEVEMSLSEAQSSPYLWIGLEGEGKAREYVLFDTGMQGFYDMSVQSYERLRELKTIEGIESGTGVKSIGLFDSTGDNTHYRTSVPVIRIGSHEFRNVPTVTMDADRSRIGSEILDYGTVVLDFRNSRFYFDPFEGERDLSEPSLGFSPTIKDGEIVVGIVWDEGLEERLDYGDRILRINGIDITAMDPCDFVNQPSPFDAGESFSILFEDTESNTEFTLELTKK